MKLRMAFQGGGANLVSYLPVIEAINEKSDNNEIDIDGLAGASAGAIAALVVALGISPKEIKKLLAGSEGSKLLEALQMPKSFFNVTWSVGRLLTGRPMLKTEPLVEFLECCLKTKGDYSPFKKLNISYPLKIAISNIETEKLELVDISDHSAGDALIIVAKSCAIPFVFTSHKPLRDNHFVDGGLFENLPIGALVDDDFPISDVYGFKFTKALDQNNIETAHHSNNNSLVGNDKTVNGKKSKYLIQNLFPVSELLKFGGKLISTSISSNVAGSLSLVPRPNICEIPTRFGTFEFEEAVSDCISNEDGWVNSYQKILAFLDKAIERSVSSTERSTSLKSSLLPLNYSELQGILGELVGFRRSKHLKQNHIYYVKLNSLGKKGGPNHGVFDDYVQIIEYEVPEEGIECIELGQTEYDTAEEVNAFSSFEIFNDNNEEIKCFPLQIKNQGDQIESEFKRIVIFLDRRIYPHETKSVRLINTERTRGGFAGLLSQGWDMAEIACESDAVFESLRILIGIPNCASEKYQINPAKKPYDDLSENLEFVEAVECSVPTSLKYFTSRGFTTIGYKAIEEITDRKALSIIISREDINVDFV